MVQACEKFLVRFAFLRRRISPDDDRVEFAVEDCAADPFFEREGIARRVDVRAVVLQALDDVAFGLRRDWEVEGGLGYASAC